MNFKDLKKRDVSGLVDELMKSEKKNDYTDARFWKTPVRDKNGNASAIIRFLPTAPGAADGSLEWTEVYSHSFQGPGGWYIEDSLSTIGGKDPLGELNSELWATGIDANKAIVRKRSRRHQYISNILVIKDIANPENEGKVFLYKYGVKIFDKIKAAMQPEFDDENAFNPFCLWTGANFRMKVKTVDQTTGNQGFPNYDASTFDTPGPLLDDDAALEAIWKKEYDLGEFTDPKNFKTYDELKARLDRVLGNKATVNESVGASPTFAASTSATAEPSWAETQQKKKKVSPAIMGHDEPPPTMDEEEDDLMAKLTALGNN